MVLVYDRIDLWDSCYVYSVGILWIRVTKGRIKMGKYIIELKEGETAYKTVDLNGMPLIQLLNLTPYTEPDLDVIRKKAYEKGLSDGKNQDVKDFAEMYDSGYGEGLKAAWECARKIGSNSMCSLKEMGFDFGQCGVNDYNPSWFVVKNYSALECIEKIQQYEQESKETELKDAINTIMAEGGYTIESIYNVIEGMRK